MIEDYGTLSEEELLDEILQELEETTEVDSSELEFKFEGGKLHIYGTLPNEEGLESLVSILENHLDPNDYEFDVDLIEGQARRPIPKEEVEVIPEATEDEKFMEESLEDIGEEEMELVEDEGAEEDNDKW